MSEINHIVAKIRWKTSFDWKERVIELQERLSSWSKNKMPRHINQIFDKFCPTAQTWKIESLELDLGNIDFANLETELTQQVSAQLNQKLTDLIINGNRNNVQIDVEDHPSTQLNLLRHFLLNGVMPWSYQENDGSILQLFAAQLKNNFSNLIALIREIGSKNLNVRRRLAWQIDDYTIKAIIKGIEPNNHEQIIEFSQEMVKIKTKENRIQGSNTDFKKNLWLWIFNYLLTERGTIFNKVAFMKSNIKQMASHYNMAYSDLLMLIDEVAREIAKKETIKQEFISIINIVVEQESAIKKNIVKKAVKINEWDLLIKYLTIRNALKTTTERNEFNDLVVGLARIDQARFTTLISSLPKEGKWIFGLSKILNDSSLGVIFSALNPSKSNEFILRMQFLAELNKEINIQIDRSAVLEIGLRFLKINQNSPFSNAKFFEYYLHQLSKKSGLKKERIAQLFISRDISSSVKTVANLAAYQNLSEAIEENGPKNPPISKLLQELADQLNNYPSNRKRIELLKNELLKKVHQNPKLTLATLIKYAWKFNDKQNIMNLFDQESTERLIKNASAGKVAVWTILQKVVDRFKMEHPDFGNWINENVFQFGLNAIIFYPKLTSTKLVEFILLKISNALKANQVQLFKLFVHHLGEEKNILVKDISAKIQQPETGSVFQQVDLLITVKGDKKTISSILQRALSNSSLNISALQKHPKRQKIADYLLGNSLNLIQALHKEYAPILFKSVSKSKLIYAHKLMDELLWRCVLDYNAHHGNQERFKKLFVQALEHHLSIDLIPFNNSQVVKVIAQQEKLIPLGKEGVLTPKELFEFLKECLEKGVAQKVKGEFTFNFIDLVKEALIQDATAFKKMWNSIPLTTERIHQLDSAISFGELSLWLKETGDGSANNAIGALKAWFELVAYLFHGEVSKSITENFYKLLWKVCRSGSVSATVFKKFVQEILFKITLVEPMNAAKIIEALKKSKIEIPPFLQHTLTQCLPNFSIVDEALDSKTGLKEEPLKSMNKDLVAQIIHQLVINHQVPAWLGVNKVRETKELLNEIILCHQVQFFLFLKQENLSDSQLKWLSEKIDFKVLIKVIGHLNNSQYALLNVIDQFYFAINKLKNRDVSAKEIQYLLFCKLLKSWTIGNWRPITVDQIWKELIWDVCVKKGIDQGSLIQSFSAIKLQLPAALQITFMQLITQQQKIKEIEKKKIIKSDPKPFFDDKELLKDSVFVQNAGLVLINHYIPMLFERLGLIENKQYLPDKQFDAVHYLQFVATGMMKTAEPELALNKILCGIPLNQPIKDEVFMTDSEIELIEQLITAMMGYWEAIGSSSIDGFRGNWLIRDGLLIEYEDKWELTIEKRAYDLLIHQSPFTFSIIKYPWMNKPLYVQWPH
jgi:hypothetical protein